MQYFFFSGRASRVFVDAIGCSGHRSATVQGDLLLVSSLGGVLEELLDQVDVRHDHTAAAVALEAELVHGLTIRGTVVHELQVSLPQVTGHLATRETADGDNHLDNREANRVV